MANLLFQNFFPGDFSETVAAAAAEALIPSLSTGAAPHAILPSPSILDTAPTAAPPLDTAPTATVENPTAGVVANTNSATSASHSTSHSTSNTDASNTDATATNTNNGGQVETDPEEDQPDPDEHGDGHGTPDEEETHVNGIGTSTHAKRNPHKPVIPIHPRARPKLSEAEKNTMTERRRLNKQKEEGLAADVEAIQADIAVRIQEVASKWNKKPELVRKRVYNLTSLKKRRKVGIRNAWIHYLSKKHNDRREGMCFCTLCSGPQLIVSLLAENQPPLTLREIQELANEDSEGEPDTWPLDKRQKILDELEDERELKQTGARANNHASAQDARISFDRISDEVCGRYFDFFSRTKGFMVDRLAGGKNRRICLRIHQSRTCARRY